MANDPTKIKQFVLAERAAGSGIFLDDEEKHLISKLRDLEIELKNAKYNFTEEHPLVQEINGKIEHVVQRLEEHANDYADTYIEVMRQKWLTAKQREEELYNSFEAQHQVTQNLGVKATEYSILKADLKRTERLCEILDNRIKELNVTEDAGALNICILEVARPATRASKPQRAKVIGTVLFMGLFFGFGLAVIRDWMDYTLRSSEEITAVLGLPILGIVPSMSEEQVIVAHSQRLWRKLKHLTEQIHQKINPNNAHTRRKHK